MRVSLVSGAARSATVRLSVAQGALRAGGGTVEVKLLRKGFENGGCLLHSGLVDATHIAPFQNYAYLLRLTARLQPQRISLQQNRR